MLTSVVARWSTHAYPEIISDFEKRVKRFNSAHRNQSESDKLNELYDVIGIYR